VTDDPRLSAIGFQRSARRRYPQRPLVGVGAIMPRRDRVLMAQRGKWWSLPGCAVEIGESLASAVYRAVRGVTDDRRYPKRPLVGVRAIMLRVEHAK